MKRRLLLVSALLILVLFVAVGCGNSVPVELYNEAVDEKEEMAAEYQALESNYQALEDDYHALEEARDSLVGDLEDKQAKLGELEKLCPPRPFRDVVELEEWLDDQPLPSPSSDAIVWLEHAMQLQRSALRDGFVINIEMTTEDGVYYTVICTAILADNSFYYWDAETHDIYYWLDVRHF